jgi:DNA-binding LytR/AlgR family response regulator
MGVVTGRAPAPGPPSRAPASGPTGRAPAPVVPAGARVPAAGLRVLAVDDEPLQLDELAFLLRADGRVGEIHTAPDATEALRQLRGEQVDVVFLDIRMPGLDGLELATVLRQFADPPAIVFVTAHEDRAVDAFDLGAADYLLKPLRAERLAESLRRVLAQRAVPGPAEPRLTGDVIPVELGGTTRLVPRSAVHWIEAQGDYARLHTADDSHLVRVSLATLAERWADAGFVRIHRSYLVALRQITELRVTASGHIVVVDGHELPVSRRHTRELKDRLVRAARDGWGRP